MHPPVSLRAVRHRYVLYGQGYVERMHPGARYIKFLHIGAWNEVWSVLTLLYGEYTIYSSHKNIQMLTPSGNVSNNVITLQSPTPGGQHVLPCDKSYAQNIPVHPAMERFDMPRQRSTTKKLIIPGIGICSLHWARFLKLQQLQK